jgi:hypothetical protein
MLTCGPLCHFFYDEAEIPFSSWAHLLVITVVRDDNFVAPTDLPWAEYLIWTNSYPTHGNQHKYHEAVTDLWTVSCLFLYSHLS